MGKKQFTYTKKGRYQRLKHWSNPYNHPKWSSTFFCSAFFIWFNWLLHHCNNSVFPGAKNLPENQAIFEYYDLMLQSISSYSFQAMAHLDFPRRYFDSWEIPEKTINSILELMIKKEILLEINTSSISNDCTEPLPSYNIIRLCHNKWLIFDEK